MGKQLFTGAATALVTPFLGGEINYPMLQQLLNRQIEAGIETVVIAGTTGEAPTLSDAEKIELFAKAKAYAGNRCSIIAGTGSNSTQHTVELSKAAEAVGVDGLLIVSPYYNKATPDGLIQHYITIANRTTLPIILYNVPGRTGLDMPVSVYQVLARIPNIIGVKEASENIGKYLDIRKQCGKDFSVWAGNDAMTIPVIACGGCGVISVVSNIFPEKVAEMVNTAERGDYPMALQLQLQLLPLTKALFEEVNPIPVKAAMKLLGYDCGNCRLPLTDAGEETLLHLRKCLE